MPVANSLETLIAQTAIQNLILNFNRAEDELDFSLLQSCLPKDDKFTLDLAEHLPGTPVVDLTAAEFWMQVKGSIPGFTASHHQIGPIGIEFEGGLKCATARTSVTATYSLLGDDGVHKSVVVKGAQIVDVEEVESGMWALRRFKIVRGVPMENVELFGVAAGRVVEGKGRTCSGP